jgi:hypothetical protein
MTGLNRIDIIRMAKESGMEQIENNFYSTNHDGIDVYITDLEHFAALVAAAEREACAKVCEAEAENLIGMAYEGIALGCAEVIRSRGQE